MEKANKEPPYTVYPIPLAHAGADHSHIVANEICWLSFAPFQALRKPSFRKPRWILTFLP